MWVHGLAVDGAGAEHVVNLDPTIQQYDPLAVSVWFGEGCAPVAGLGPSAWSLNGFSPCDIAVPDSDLRFTRASCFALVTHQMGPAMRAAYGEEMAAGGLARETMAKFMALKT